MPLGRIFPDDDGFIDYFDYGDAFWCALHECEHPCEKCAAAFLAAKQAEHDASVKRQKAKIRHPKVLESK